MTAERPADVAALTEEDEQLVEVALNAADAGSAGPWPTAAGYLADEVRRLRLRVAAAYAEGYEAGRAEVTAAVEALVHEDWCCARGCAGYGFCEGCDGTEADCRCMKSIFRATLAAATTAYGGTP